jgi:hypothetical protein
MVQIDDCLKMDLIRFQSSDLHRIFPIPDVPSAHLMKIKAQSLYFVGIITAAQKAEVERRADGVIRAPKITGKTLRAQDRAIPATNAGAGPAHG